MPYLNKEKQREFQRNWARIKGKKRIPVKSSFQPDFSYAQFIDGLTKNVTGNEVQQWEALVNIAKNLKQGVSLNRMAIAELANRACTVIRGGDMRSANRRSAADMMTINHFAAAVRLNSNTLGRWMICKNRFFIHLTPQEQRNFKLTAAERARNEISEFHKGDFSVERCVATYRKWANISPQVKLLLRFRAYFRLTHYWVTDRNVLSKFTPQERAMFRDWALQIAEKAKGKKSVSN